MTDLDNRTWPSTLSEDPLYKGKKTTRELGHSTTLSFVSRGHVFCRELGFHGVRRPMPADESRITALAPAGPHRLFGATSGERCHVFLYCSEPREGVVIDLGVIEEATTLRNRLVAVDRSTACVATDLAPGRIIKCSAGNWHNDCIQEWWHAPGEFEEIASPIPEEGIACIVYEPESNRIVGLSSDTGTLFTVDPETGQADVVGEVDEVHHFSPTLVACGGSVYGAGALGRIFCYRPDASPAIRHLDVSIPAVPGRAVYARVDSWAEDPTTGIIYGGTAADGILFAFDTVRETMRSLGNPTKATRIPAIAVGNDGVVYGTSGEDGNIGYLFAYDSRTGSLENLGIPLATMEIRRYGYEFGAAATGANGEIYLGENDRGGCLFIYFPPIPKRPQPEENSPGL